MNRETTIKVFTEKLRNQEPFSFVKIGDDCVFCMRGQTGANAEGHQYSPKLSKHLRKAYDYLKDRSSVYMAEWDANHPGLVFFDALLLHEDSYLTPDLRDFYQLLKDDPRPKYYFARERMKEAATVFNMELVPVPWPNSYVYIGQVLKKVKEIARPGVIILFSCGMLSKVMIYECHKINPDMTVLDMGSAFDPLFVGSTRSANQYQHLKVKKYYRELLQD